MLLAVHSSTLELGASLSAEACVPMAQRAARVASCATPARSLSCAAAVLQGALDGDTLAMELSTHRKLGHDVKHSDSSFVSNWTNVERTQAQVSRTPRLLYEASQLPPCARQRQRGQGPSGGVHLMSDCRSALCAILSPSLSATKPRPPACSVMGLAGHRSTLDRSPMTCVVCYKGFGGDRAGDRAV